MRALPRFAVALLIAVIAVIVATVRAGAGRDSDWFASDTRLSLRLEAPFNELFAHAQQDGYAVRGSLIRTDAGSDRRIDNVKVTVRGNTSRRESECTFPKLKLSWNGGSLKVGTHCGESTGDDVTPKYGRLPNQTSPVREAFVYKLLALLGVPTLRARPAEITYVYTDADEERGSSITRNAFLLEDDEDARERLGATRTVSEEQFTNARDRFAPEATARIAFGEALIGNFDWCLRFSAGDRYRCDARHPLWNVLAFAWPDGTVRPLMYDFDVSGVVAGYHRWFGDIFNERFLPSRSEPAIEVTAQLQHARSLFDRGVLDATRRAFAARKDVAYRALQESAVDGDGRKIFTAYMDAFFDAMTSDEVFYRPVVTAANTHVYADAARTKPVCETVGALPIGTPVGDPIATRGGMMQVVVLDAMWKFAPPVKCASIREKPVWIAKSAVGVDYP